LIHATGVVVFLKIIDEVVFFPKINEISKGGKGQTQHQYNCNQNGHRDTSTFHNLKMKEACAFVSAGKISSSKSTQPKFSIHRATLVSFSQLLNNAPQCGRDFAQPRGRHFSLTATTPNGYALVQPFALTSMIS
jgi:hypothetical protein